MEEAIAADPDFGPAYRSLAEMDSNVRIATAAMAVLRALSRAAASRRIEHARIQSDAANIAERRGRKQEALAAHQPNSSRQCPHMAIAG